MLSKNVKMTGVLTLALVVGLLTAGFVGLADNGREAGPERPEIMEETYIELLAEKLDLEPAQLEQLTDEARNRAESEEARPISDNYLEILSTELNLNVEDLETTMAETKIEAAEQLATEGTISEEMAETLKERASTFPFGYSNQGEDRRNARAQSGENDRSGGNRYGPNEGNDTPERPKDGSDHGPGEGGGRKGNSEGKSSRGREIEDEDKRGNSSRKRGGK